MDSTQLYNFLDVHGIHYERYDHPAVFTCEEADRLVPDLPGAKTKNLFLCDDRGRAHFLVTLPDTKSVDLKAFAKALGVKKLRFASAERLKTFLHLNPGSVSLLAAVNDRDGKVSVVLDQEIDASSALLCHPLVNTSTLLISRAGIDSFLDAANHPPIVMNVPGRRSGG